MPNATRSRNMNFLTRRPAGQVSAFSALSRRAEGILTLKERNRTVAESTPSFNSGNAITSSVPNFSDTAETTFSVLTVFSSPERWIQVRCTGVSLLATTRVEDDDPVPMIAMGSDEPALLLAEPS